MASMAAAATTTISTPSQAQAASSLRRQAVAVTFGSRSSFASFRGRFPSIQLMSATRRFHVSCSARPETVDKVCAIVKKQLALSPDSTLTGESKFSELGADSLDTVEIVMGFEEEFGISVEEDSAQNIQTVQDAADMIEKLVAKKSG